MAVPTTASRGEPARTSARPAATGGDVAALRHMIAATRIAEPIEVRVLRRDTAGQPPPEPARWRRWLGRFRVPGRGDPTPGSYRLAGICAWAAGMGLIGVAVAIRAVLAALLASPPGWYLVCLVPIGVVGAALTVAAFLCVHQRRLPWLLLAAATAPLLTSIALTVLALP